jgi:hypothetical protein
MDGHVKGTEWRDEVKEHPVTPLVYLTDVAGAEPWSGYRTDRTHALAATG